MKRGMGLLLGLLLVLGGGAVSWAWWGEVVHVHDGDHLVVERGGKPTNVRLYGVDAPEKGQPYWEEARHLVAYWLLHQRVEVTPVNGGTRGVYGLVRLESGKELVNKRLVRYGMAWVLGRYTTAGLVKEWKRLENLARANGVGLWADPDPMPPQEWRLRRLLKQPSVANVGSRGR